jgi:hypothetical protein
MPGPDFGYTAIPTAPRPDVEAGGKIKMTIYNLPGGEKLNLPSDWDEGRVNAMITQRLEDLKIKPIGQGTVGPAPMVDLGRMVRQSALPVVGGALGGAGGSLLAPGPGTVMGTAVGSGLGEMANQGLGITPRSNLQVGLAGALPLAGAGIRSGFLNLPGSEAGQQQLALRRGQGIAAGIGPAVDPSRLYQQAAAAGTAVPKGPVLSALQSVADQEAILAPPLQSSGVKRGIRAVSWILANPPDSTEIQLKALMPNLSRLGEIYGKAVRDGDPGRKQLGELYSGIQRAIDTAATEQGGQGAILLRQANDAFKRKLASEELTDLVTKSTTSMGGHEGLNADAVVRALTKGKDLTTNLSRWIGDEEAQGVREAFQALAKIPPVSSAGQSGVSGMGFAQRALVGGALGSLLAPEPGTGAVLGVLGTEALVRTLMSPPGRAVVKALSSERIGGQAYTVDQILNMAYQVARTNPESTLQLGARGLQRGLRGISQLAAPSETPQRSLPEAMRRPSVGLQP